MNPLKSHPNAVMGGGAGGIGLLVVWALNRYLGAALDAEEGALIATGAVTVILFVGREGVRGAVRRLWTGEARESTIVAVEVSKVGTQKPTLEVTTTGASKARTAKKTPPRKPAAKKPAAKKKA